jgi:hypothetical protein
MRDHECYPVSGICGADQPCPAVGGAAMMTTCGGGLPVRIGEDSAPEHALLSVTGKDAGHVYSVPSSQKHRSLPHGSTT